MKSMEIEEVAKKRPKRGSASNDAFGRREWDGGAKDEADNDEKRRVAAGSAQEKSNDPSQN